MGIKNNRYERCFDYDRHLCSYILSFLICGCAALLPSTTAAEFGCNAEVSYKWKQKEGEKGKEKEIEVTTLWSAHEKVAADENAAKAALADIILKEKIKAEDACRKQHENLAACMSSKFTAISTTLQGVGFSARRQIEEAIASDCKQQQGSCAGASATEPKCEEKIDAKAAEAAKAEAEKKDEKGKGKAKKK